LEALQKDVSIITLTGNKVSKNVEELIDEIGKRIDSELWVSTKSWWNSLTAVQLA